MGASLEDTQEQPPWASVPTERTVLMVLHNVTTLNRLLDLVDVLAGDPRVQVVVTSELTDPFADDLPEQVAALGMAAIPWTRARETTFDLVVAAGHHGSVAGLRGPLVLLPHGAGFGKVAPGGASAYGLGPEWVLHEGRPFADALVFSHPEQAERLGGLVPEAASSAYVAGDPCFDRMLASEPHRAQYRQALGGRPVVLVSSTWSTHGLLGQRFGLVHDLVTALPDHQVVLVAHPNIWAWHGRFQLLSWLADARQAGLRVLPPLQGWQAAVVAADAVIGDHGSVTVYAAGLGRPTLLAACADADVVEGTAADALRRKAPRLDDRPLRDQVGSVITHPPDLTEVAAMITDTPGHSLTRLRDLFYRLLRLAPPADDPVVRPYSPEGLAQAVPLIVAEPRTRVPE